ARARGRGASVGPRSARHRAGRASALRATRGSFGRALRRRDTRAPCATLRRRRLVCEKRKMSTAEKIRAIAKQRILVLDGAMGTMIQRHKLEEADYRGARFASHGRDLKGDNDLLVLTKPDVVRGIHAA